jgi:hypothetical protein
MMAIIAFVVEPLRRISSVANRLEERNADPSVEESSLLVCSNKFIPVV